MKREVPMMITFVVCAILLLDFILNWAPVNYMAPKINDYTSIVATFAMVLGLASLFNVHLNRIYKKRENWIYSVVLIIAFVIAVIFASMYGIKKEYSVFITEQEYNNFLVKNKEIKKENLEIKEKNVELAISGKKKLKSKKKYSIKKQTLYYIQIAKKEYKISKEIYNLPTIENQKKVKTVKYIENKENFWFDTFIFHTIYEPLQATMFSLLAFFMASAAFRAFRAKSIPAALLLGSAFLVMLGRVPLGETLGLWISNIIGLIPLIPLNEWLVKLMGYFGWTVKAKAFFPDLSTFIVTVLNTAGQRAIMIGAALGMVAASLRIWFGFEKEHLGRD